MAPVTAVVIAILRSAWRNLRRAGSFTGNNLTAVIALMMAEEPRDRPSSAAPVYLIVGLLWAIPLSRELTQRIPPVRFRLWPFTSIQKALIYTFNLLLNPLIVIAILFGTLSRDRAVGLGLVVTGAVTPIAVILGQAVTGRHAARSPLRCIPRPPGRLGGLIQNHIRELLQLLDVYFALLTAVGGIAYCHFGTNPDPAASLVFGQLVVLIMSTCAQGQVSFDARASETRLMLLPVSKLDVLFAKDAAWLLVTLPLIAGFPLLPGIAAALGALTLGHKTSIGPAVEQKRWNFATGKLAPEGILQMLALVGAGSSVYKWGWPAFAAVMAAYAGSLWWSGRVSANATLICHPRLSRW